MSIENLKNVLFFPTVNTFEQFLANIMMLFVIYTILAYLINLFLLQTPMYKSKREFVDADFRAKLGWSVGFLFSVFLLTANVIYIWLNGNFRKPIDILCHWTVMLITLIIWFVLFSSKKRDLRSARKALS